MSVEDIRYVEKMTSKRPGSAKTPSDDDIPLAALKPDTTRDQPPRSATPKKGPSIDWFEFFLSAGCQLDDCTRYASSFERDKIDAALLPDITDATMRSLGLLEGDIIRVGKLIQQRKLKATNGSDLRKEQLLHDEELARQLQAEEDAGAGSRAPAPNLFAGPQGVLKTTRRGRPQPSKSLPPATVDLDAISPASGQSSGSPRIVSPVQPPPKSSPALAVPSGFDDDAWSNRPSSTKPTPSAPAVPAERAPSAPPTSVAPVTPAPAASPPRTGSSLAKTTESDVFGQLARLSELRTRNPATISPSPSLPASTSGIISPAARLGAGPQPQPQPAGFLPPANAPRGPFAPVPTNQALLQPLIPTNSNLGGFIPTRPTSNLMPPMQSQPAFVSTQPTGFLSQQPPGFIGAQMTGFPGPQMMMSQPTGMPMMGNFDSGNTFAQPSAIPLIDFKSMLC
jgi:actin cytoskeleton-regulatory complex protein SLA1